MYDNWQYIYCGIIWSFLFIIELLVYRHLTITGSDKSQVLILFLIIHPCKYIAK